MSSNDKDDEELLIRILLASPADANRSFDDVLELRVILQIIDPIWTVVCEFESFKGNSSCLAIIEACRELSIKRFDVAFLVFFIDLVEVASGKVESDFVVGYELLFQGFYLRLNSGHNLYYNFCLVSALNNPAKSNNSLTTTNAHIHLQKILSHQFH